MRKEGPFMEVPFATNGQQALGLFEVSPEPAFGKPVLLVQHRSLFQQPDGLCPSGMQLPVIGGRQGKDLGKLQAIGRRDVPAP